MIPSCALHCASAGEFGATWAAVCGRLQDGVACDACRIAAPGDFYLCPLPQVQLAEGELEGEFYKILTPLTSGVDVV